MRGTLIYLSRRSVPHRSGYRVRSRTGRSGDLPLRRIGRSVPTPSWPRCRRIAVAHYPGRLVAPGFIDTHIHYVQTRIIGDRGTSCWTGSTTTPTRRSLPCRREGRPRNRRRVLRRAVAAWHHNCVVFCSVHAGSVDALFEAAEERNMRLIAGKVLMDRNAPVALTDTARSGYDQSMALIGTWHGRGRCLYAITPRFAATARRSNWSSPVPCGASIPARSCRPISLKTATRSPGLGVPAAARLSRRLRPLRAGRPPRGAGSGVHWKKPISRAVTPTAPRWRIARAGIVSRQRPFPAA